MLVKNILNEIKTVSSMVIKLIRGLLMFMVELLMPASCIACGAMILDISVREGGAVCPDCWGKIRFLGGSLCQSCGYPFREQRQVGVCPSCAKKRPLWGKARAALVYNDGSRDMILAFKYADRTSMTRSFSLWMISAGHELLTSADFLLPVPLHRWRLFSRRYNQAALLTKEISKITKIPCIVNNLQRTRQTPPQGRLGVRLRKANVAGAFAIADKSILEGKRIVLIDDVLTSGATIDACVRVLLRAGVANIDVLTLARVVFVQDIVV